MNFQLEQFHVGHSLPDGVAYDVRDGEHVPMLDGVDVQDGDYVLTVDCKTHGERQLLRAVTGDSHSSRS